MNETLHPFTQRLNEDIWFEYNQQLLLQMANTRSGRDLLCIDQDFPLIIEIAKNRCTGLLEHRGKSMLKFSDIRIGAKWGNVIRSRWDEFQRASRFFLNNETKIPMSPLTRYSRSVVATVTTVYPDPNPETSTFDGNVAFSDATWSTARGSGTALDVVRDDAANELSRVTTAFRIDRIIFGFDTSGIADTDTIDSGNLQIYVNSFTDSDNDANAYNAVTAMSSAPFSSTSINASDYGLITATEWTDQVDISGLSTAAYNTYTLNATGLSGVSKTGITWMMFREGHDIQNDAPNGTSGIDDLSMSERAGTGEDPKLTITHSAVTFTPRLLIF